MIINTRQGFCALTPPEVIKALRAYACQVVSHHNVLHYPTECTFEYDEDGQLFLVKFKLIREDVKESCRIAAKPRGMLAWLGFSNGGEN